MFTIILIFSSSVLVYFLLLFTGKLYLIKGVSATYLRGKKGPGIYDLKTFPTRIVRTSDKVKPWEIHRKHFFQPLQNKYKTFFQRLRTTSFLVIENDAVIFERYYKGASHNSISNSFSMAKSIVGLMVAIAVKEGKIESINDPVSKYIKAFRDGELKSEVRIIDVLNMSCGMIWSESSSNPFAHVAKAYYSKRLSTFIYGLEFTEKANEKFEYQSGATQILAEILVETTGEHLSDYLSEKLWKPLGCVKEAEWSLDRKRGREKAFCCIYATSRDFAKVGQLIMNEGKIDGCEIIPRWYIDLIWNPPTIIDEELQSENHRYSGHWWRMKYRGREIVYMRGILGQYMFIIPLDNLIVVRTGHKRMLEDEYGHPKDVYQYLDAAFLLRKQLNNR